MEKYLPTIVLIALLCRILVTGAGVGEALALLALSGLYGFHLYLNHKKAPKANQELWDRVISLEEQIKITKEKVSAVQIGNSLKR